MKEKVMSIESVKNDNNMYILCGKWLLVLDLRQG